MSLSPSTEQTVDVGDGVTLTASVTPTVASDKSVEWNVNGGTVKLHTDETCRTEVGTMSATDKLTVYAKGVAEGRSTVTVKVHEDNAACASCDVLVRVPHTHTIGEGDEAQTITFEPWTSDNSLPSEPGSHYLTEDVTLSNTWYVPEGSPVNLCLNGKAISRTGGLAIKVKSSGTTLDLYDCSGDAPGAITGSYCGVDVHYGTFNMHGGRISGNAAGGKGGGVYNFGGTLELSGDPTIAGNTVGDAADNARLWSAEKMTAAGALDGTASVGVTMGKPGVFTASTVEGALPARDYAANFSSDDNAYVVGTQGDELRLVPLIEATATGYAGTYDGKAHGITVTVTKPETGAKVTYGEGEDGCTEDESPEYTDAGTYTVWYKVTADGYAEKTGSATVAIDKADPEVTAPEGRRLDYSGEAQELVAAGGTSGGTMVYALGDATAAPEEGWGASVPTATDAGACHVWYRVDGGANYKDNEAMCVDATIEKADPKPATFAVDLKGGANATASGGATRQAVEAGKAMATVTYAARAGYHFEGYAGETRSGVTAGLEGGRATVSGTPTADVQIAVPDVNSIAASSSGSPSSGTACRRFLACVASLAQWRLCEPSSLVAAEPGTGSRVRGEACEVLAMTHASKRSLFAMPGHVLRAWLSACPGRQATSQPMERASLTTSDPMLLRWSTVTSTPRSPASALASPIASRTSSRLFPTALSTTASPPSARTPSGSSCPRRSRGRRRAPTGSSPSP